MNVVNPGSLITSWKIPTGPTILCANMSDILGEHRVLPVHYQPTPGVVVAAIRAPMDEFGDDPRFGSIYTIFPASIGWTWTTSIQTLELEIAS